MKWLVVGLVLGVVGQARAEGPIVFGDYPGLAKGGAWAVELSEESTNVFPLQAEYDHNSSYQYTVLVVAAKNLQPVGRLGVFVERGQGTGKHKDGKYEWTLTPPDRVRIEGGKRSSTSQRSVTPPVGPKLVFAGEARVDPRGKPVRDYPIDFAGQMQAISLLWPELPARPVTVGQSYTITRVVSLFGVPVKDTTFQVKVASLEGDVVTLELRGVRPVEVADFTGEGEFRWLHMHPSAKGQLTLTGKARIRRTDVEWLGGELEAQLQLAEDGKTISRVWKRYKATLTPRPKPDLTEWVERILEHGTGN